MTEKKDPKAILLNATGLGYQVIKALRKRNVRSIVIYDREEEELGHHSRYVSESFKVPGFIEDPQRLLSFLIDKGPDWSGSLLIPTKDYGVEFMSRNREALSRYYVVSLPDIDTISRIIDKKNLYHELRRLGVGVPRTFSAGSRKELMELRDQLSFPCLLKPGLAHPFLRKFGYKMLEVNSFDELLHHYTALTDDFTTDDYDLMICEVIPGADSRYMVQYVSYIDRSGETLAWMTSRKMRQDPPRWGQGRVVRSEKVTAVDWPSRSLLNDLGYSGFSEIEWKYDYRDNTYKVIEINTRFIFYLGLCLACGINFPYIQYADLILDRQEHVNSFRENVYWIHEYKDFLHTLFNHRMERISTWEYLRPYLGRKSLAIFDPGDPRPFFYQLKEHANNALNRARR